jgi:hypothetical protein
MDETTIDTMLSKKYGSPEKLSSREAAEYISDFRQLENDFIREDIWNAVFNQKTPVTSEAWDAAFQSIMEKFKKEVNHEHYGFSENKTKQ